jgi:hypothetical protein
MRFEGGIEDKLQRRRYSWCKVAYEILKRKRIGRIKLE